jgi:AraC family transcriptional regulator
MLQESSDLRERYEIPSDPLLGSRLASKVIQLLQTADEALSHDRLTARRFIDQAMTLLHQRAASATDTMMCGGLSPWQVRRIAERIEKQLESPLKTSQLAGLVDLSTGYFCHAFKKSFGQSPHAYITRKRVERAQDLMLATDEPLSQIAVACGLADQSHLSRLFRRVVGQNPNSWRRARKARPRKIRSTVITRDVSQ